MQAQINKQKKSRRKLIDLLLCYYYFNNEGFPLSKVVSEGDVKILQDPLIAALCFFSVVLQSAYN